MAKIEIYTTPFCGYCARAKGLLEKNPATEPSLPRVPPAPRTPAASRGVRVPGFFGYSTLVGCAVVFYSALRQSQAKVAARHSALLLRAMWGEARHSGTPWRVRLRATADAVEGGSGW